jgi:hypothetical protein
MTPQEVETHYGSKAEIALVLGCKLPSIYEWFEEGKGVPEGRQYQLELATDGKLRADKPANRNAESAADAKAGAAITRREGPSTDTGQSRRSDSTSKAG